MLPPARTMDINRTVIVPYAAADMYALVDNIEDYPQFLPWCDASEVQRDGERVEARLDIVYRGFRTGFTTRNLHTPSECIRMELAEGPLSALTGEWHFIPIEEHRCRVELRLQYEFSNKIMAATLGKIFAFVFDHFVDHFIDRARSQYRKIDVEIVQATDGGLQAQALRLPPTATVADALAAAKLPYSASVSVFGKLCAEQTPLKDGDRIEINQALPNSPQQARRQRQ